MEFMHALPSGRAVRSSLLLGAAFFALPLSVRAQDNGRPGQINGVQDIVVTAQKREQNLQKVPISITALSADSIKANRIQSVNDLNAIAPNLTVRLGSGGNQSPNYTLRGILGGNSAAGTDKGVSLYLDGVYLQNQSGSVFEFADIERIEVLKGPQGTLFGRNATGGAISIITKDPTGRFGGHQDFTIGNQNSFRSKTHIDLPQFGPISASFTYLHSQHRGDVRNLGAGTTWDYGPATGGAYGVAKSPKWLGGDNTEAVQAALKFDLDPNLDLVYKFDYTDDRFTPNAQGTDYLPAGSFLSELYDASPNPKTPITNKRPDAVNNWFTTPGHTVNWGHNLTAKYTFNDNISIKNIFALRKSRLHVNFQLDGLGGLMNQPVAGLGGYPPGIAIPFAPGGNPTLFSANPSAPFIFLGNNAYSNEKQWSDEFQLNITTDWFTLTAGYLHFHDHFVTAGYNNAYNTSITQVIDGQNTSAAGTAFVIPANPGYLHTTVSTNSDAFFLQPEIHLTDQLDLVGGARITIDDKNGIEYLPDQYLAGNVTGMSPVSSPIRYKHSKATFLAGINYRVNDHILTYAKYATGYVSGGELATLQFKPETAKSFEGGIKADLFDRRFRTNLALFHVKYTNLQYDTSGQLTGVPSTFLFSQAVVSSGDAKAYGFEWENTLVPVNGLTLQANLGYTHFKFIKDTIFPGFAYVSGAPGYLPFQRPKWTGNLSAQYDSSAVLLGGHLTARVDANFRSRILMTSDITPGVGPTAQADPALVKAATTPFQWIVNARVGLADVDLGRSKVEIAAWGRNILNNRNITQFTGLGLVASVIYERARTYGLDVSFAF
ncbi:TonB-dependent receptor [Flavisphingomonas formosensis]|uniref:TonB-dependent receptor n=1 Tax=Flavisphingomonas formosensis TaxID=861534 RepID=UPI0012F97250|nr:TonB-dependent receptor [Sphingomonas formosensis]